MIQKSSQHYTGFRVVVYRLKFPDTATILGFSADKMFNSEFWNSDYVGYENAIDKNPNTAMQFVSDTNKAISSLIVGGLQPAGTAPGIPGTSFAAPFSSNVSREYQQIEITPIVEQVDINLSLADMNTCSIRMADPSIVEFKQDSIQTWIKQNPIRMPWVTNNGIASYLSGLQAFEFKEFDLIRVYEYSSTAKSLTNKVAELRSAGIADEFAMSPAFTGFVVSSSRSVSSDSMPIITASCMGVSRVFVQSVMTSSEATASVVTTADPNVTALQNAFSAFGTQFQTKTADQAFQYVVDQYLHPLWIQNGNMSAAFSAAISTSTASSTAPVQTPISPVVSPSSTSVPIIGIPDLRRFMNPVDISSLLGSNFVSDVSNPITVSATYGPADASQDITTVPTSGAGISDQISVPLSSAAPASWIPKLVPFLPACVILHILKMLRHEPLAIFDDRLDGDNWITRQLSSTASVGQPPITTNSGEDYGHLKPYLEMVRTNWAIYDSSYMSAASIFSDIRSKTYMEIFEDRTGAFHFRLPRYNNSRAYTVINPEDTISATVNRTDSSEYNVVTVHRMSELIGPVPGLGGVVDLDRLSIMRYGIRMPQIEENPNAQSGTFAKALAAFIRGYTQGKTSRTAAITQLVDPNVNVGDIVYFSYGPPYGYKTKNRGLSTSVQNSTLVGYVTSISESLTAKGAFTQTLNLEFVRPAFVASKSSQNGTYGKNEPINTIISLSDFSSVLGPVSNKVLATNVVNALNYAANPYEQSFNDPLKWMISNLPHRQGIDFGTRYIPHPRDLIEASADPTVVAETGSQYQLTTGVLPPQTPSGQQASIINLNNHKKLLGSYQLCYAILSDFSGSLPAILATAKSGLSAGTIPSLGVSLFTAFNNSIISIVGTNMSLMFNFNVNGINGLETIQISLGRPQSVTWYEFIIFELNRMYNDAKNIGSNTFYGDWIGLFQSGANSVYSDPGRDRTRAINLLQFASDNMNNLAVKYQNAVTQDIIYRTLENQVKNWGALNAAAKQ